MKSNLQNKLSNFEVHPPEAVWDKIAGALDDENNFADRLFFYSVAPPAQSWEKISSRLDEVPNEKPLPFIKRYRTPIRYLAAACFLAAILVTTTLLIKRTDAGGSLPLATEPAGPTVAQPGNPSKNDVVLRSDEKVTTATLGNDVQTASFNSNRRTGFISQQLTIRAITLAGKFIPKAAKKQALFSATALNNYMVYSNGEGIAMRVPKKLFGLVHCQEGDGSCKERLQVLQEKLTAGANTSDFIGMIEMLRQLQ